MKELYIVYTGEIDTKLEVDLENLLASHGWKQAEKFSFGEDGSRQICFDKEE